jgi:two-component system sensor histidine kinase VanS
MFIFLTGYVIIFLFFWFKTLGYLEDVIGATTNVYDSKDDLISLPTELKEVEKQMNQIKLSVRQNERAAKEAEQRKNDLIVYLAHDLKTPLTSVIGYLSLLRDEQQISEELREKYLSISLSKAERLEDLINEFFEITRFNLTSLTLELSRLNLGRMLEQISYEFQPLLDEKNLKCALKLPSDLEIKCDVDKMQRVFDNLIRNAINYSFPNSEIQIIVTKKMNEIQIDFMNQGNTIPAEKLSRIFEQFFRLDTARTSKTGGAGLGLAIAKEIIELHHGTITASSENERIHFQIILPALS